MDIAAVCFSNWPFGVKRFQTIHHHSVDVASRARASLRNQHHGSSIMGFRGRDGPSHLACAPPTTCVINLIVGRAMGIRDKPIAAGSPWQNAYAERPIGTLRRECLDRVIVFGGAGAGHRATTVDAAHYWKTRARGRDRRPRSGITFVGFKRPVSDSE